ncbi:hypothetical protein HMPREF3198_02051 [Winkia neuii]|nr:hypothetical protein HMPREF3198_02051 [Winkia neuii]
MADYPGGEVFTCGRCGVCCTHRRPLVSRTPVPPAGATPPAFFEGGPELAGG